MLVLQCGYVQQCTPGDVLRPAKSFLPRLTHHLGSVTVMVVRDRHQRFAHPGGNHGKLGSIAHSRLGRLDRVAHVLRQVACIVVLALQRLDDFVSILRRA